MKIIPFIQKLFKKKPTQPLNSFKHFSRLPGDIILDNIIPHLSMKTTANLARTSKPMYKLLSPTIFDDATRLLLYVANDELIVAGCIAKKNPDLLRKKRKVTDRSGRTFNGITPFLYSIWVKNAEMWPRLRKPLTDEDAAKQLREHLSETNPPDYVKEHGKHIDLQPVVNLYDRCSSYMRQFYVRYAEWDERPNPTQIDNPQEEMNKCRATLPMYVYRRSLCAGNFFDSFELIKKLNAVTTATLENELLGKDKKTTLNSQ